MKTYPLLPSVDRAYRASTWNEDDGCRALEAARKGAVYTPRPAVMVVRIVALK